MESNSSYFSAQTYAEFLQMYYFARKKNDPGFSFGKWSRLLGLKSRSYLSDLLSGKKKISQAVTAQLYNTMALEPILRDFFIVLVERERPIKFLDKTAKARLYRRVQREERGGVLTATGVADEWFTNCDWPYVFAAMGPIGQKSSLDQLSQRSGLASARVERALQHLIHLGVVSNTADSYEPIEQTVMLKNKGQKHFQNFHLDAIQRGQHLAEKDFANIENLFMSLVFSISKSRQKELRNALQEFLFDFCNENEVAEGDKIATLSCQFYSS